MDGVTCSTSDAPDAPADVPPVLTLPILDEIDRTVTVGTSGSSLLAVQAAAGAAGQRRVCGCRDHLGQRPGRIGRGHHAGRRTAMRKV